MTLQLQGHFVAVAITEPVGQLPFGDDTLFTEEQDKVVDQYERHQEQGKQLTDPEQESPVIGYQEYGHNAYHRPVETATKEKRLEISVKEFQDDEPDW